MAVDVFAILKDQADELELADLEMLEVALQTGSYSRAEVNKGLAIIEGIRFNLYQKLVPEKPSEPKEEENKETTPAISEKSVEKGNGKIEDSDVPLIRKNFRLILTVSRLNNDSTHTVKTALETISKDGDIIKYLDIVVDMLSQKELSSTLTWLNYPEELLEKYFVSLDKKMIAQHQFFSEEFFIRHYNDLSANLVLKKGKNPWRKPDAMSNKLKAFLKLKGAKI